MSMRGARAKRREADKRLAADIAAAAALVRCGDCARDFRGQSAYEVAHDGGRCLAGWTIESLLECRDAVWRLRRG